MHTHDKFAVGRAMLDMAIRAPDGDKTALIGLASAQADTRLEGILDKLTGRDHWFSFGRDEESKSVFVRITNNIGFVGNQTREDFVSAIGDAANVELFIDSCGGSTDMALELADLLTSRNTTATVTGRCCSAAVPIFLAASHRMIQPEGRMMVHNPVAHTVGNVETHAMSIRGLEKLNARLIDFIASRTGQTPAVVADWLTPPDRWFDAHQAVDAGLAHEICPDTAPATATFTPCAGAFQQTQTDDERMVLDLFRACGRIRVASKERFGLAVAEIITSAFYE